MTETYKTLNGIVLHVNNVLRWIK